MITQARLKELLHYDPETGVFTCLTYRPGSRGKGAPAGWVNSTTGYIDVCLDYKNYGAHRLAHLYMTGKWPLGEIDHKDRVRTNNAWMNLRDATESQNKGHRLAKGWQKSSNGKRFQALIMVRGKRVMLGTYDTPDEAHSAYVDAALKMRGDYVPTEYLK